MSRRGSHAPKEMSGLSRGLVDFYLVFQHIRGTDDNVTDALSKGNAK